MGPAPKGSNILRLFLKYPKTFPGSRRYHAIGEERRVADSVDLVIIRIDNQGGDGNNNFPLE
jgi:hypothetical protein